MYSKEYIYTSMRCHTTPVHLNSTLQQYAMSYYNSMRCHTTTVCFVILHQYAKHTIILSYRFSILFSLISSTSLTKDLT